MVQFDHMEQGRLRARVPETAETAKAWSPRAAALPMSMGKPAATIRFEQRCPPVAEI
jgi:hypothetical protein